MTEDELVELMAENAHNSWMQAYLDQGYTSRLAEWGEEFMVPYDQLTERGKDLDRTIMRSILWTFATHDLKVVDDASGDPVDVHVGTFGGYEIEHSDGSQEGIGIGQHPARKSVMLYHDDGHVLQALAYFRSREAAETAWRLIKTMVRGRG